MLTETAAKARKLADLPTVQSDSLLALIALANADPRPHKIDVGVGVYRDAEGRTPILKVMKEAEKRLLETQTTKAYLGGAGDKRFAELLRPILLGEHTDDERIHGLQTPGGCGALRLGFELIAGANPNARVFIGTPTWPNHPPIVHAVGLDAVEYPYYERGQAVIRFEDMLDALGEGAPGDVALLHGCCHNPTGADLSDEQWQAVTRVVVERGLIPFVDIAYQGFGRGLDEDAYGLRGILQACDEVIIAQSCDKNFSCYRDRVGSLFVKTGSHETTATAMAHVLQRAREMWSMPPDHGAAAAHIILDDPELRALAGRARRDARAHQFGAPAHRLRRPAPRFHRPAVRHVLDAPAEQGAGAQAARGPCDLHGRQRPLQRRRHERRGDRPICLRGCRGT